tara:strand:- start:1181 stop:1498 length:318 start_codon:yes stop_codon:yes gene_type:complete
MSTGSVADAVRKQGGVVTHDINEAISLVCQENGPQVVCHEQTAVSPPSAASQGPQLTRSEKDLIKRVMGGRREQTILSQILANRGGVLPSDWQKLVLKQGIWLER